MAGNVELRRSVPIGERRVENDHTEPQKMDGRAASRKAALNSSVEALSGVYGLLISTLGIVLPLSLFLKGQYTYKADGVYVTVFHMYVYLVALAFLAYTWIATKRIRKTMTMGENPSKPRYDKTRSGVYTINPEQESAGDINQENTDNEKKYKLATQADESDILEEAPPIYEGTEGVNFFLRMGLVAFSVGGGLLEGFRVMQFAEDDHIWDCFGAGYLVLSLTRLIFLLTQTFILFKYHKVVLNFHRSIMKFGTMHLIAANVCTWALTIVLEAVESYTHAIASHSDVHKRAAGPQPAASHHSSLNATSSTCEDIFPTTLATLAGPYLFPFMIEYSLLAAAIYYRINATIGPAEFREVQEHAKHHAEIKASATLPALRPTRSGGRCHKAHTGLFLGLAVFIVVAISCCFFLYFKTSGTAPEVVGMLHICTDLSVNIVAGLILIPAFWQTGKLYFTATVGKMLDQNLLVLALLGYYLLLCFMAVAAFAQSNYPDPYGRGAKLLGSMAIIDILQSTLQVFFIIDGLRRRAVTDTHVKTKPGRSIITFLLIANISLWLVNTFMLKESYGFRTFSGYYGDLAWIIILNITLPLAIYFRFHAAVCLSEIWLYAYKKTSVEKVARQDMERCGKLL